MTEEQRQTDHDLIVALSEQVKSLRDLVNELKGDIKELNDGIVRNIEKLQDYKEDKKEVKRLWEEAQGIHQSFVTKAEFSPIKKIVYGAVSIVLTMFLGAVVYYFIPKSMPATNYQQQINDN